MTSRFLPVSSLKTAARCWVPASRYPYRSFSLRQRLVSFGDKDNVNLIANDDVFTAPEETHNSEKPFEPTVFSSEDVFTAGPVNKA